MASDSPPLDDDISDHPSPDRPTRSPNNPESQQMRRVPGRRRLCKINISSSSPDLDAADLQLQDDVDCDDDDDDDDCDGTDYAEEDFKLEAAAGGSKPYKLPARIFKMLFPHQREGLGWLWFLHCRGTGGILGDEMGLGKTMQVSAFLSGLFHSGLIRRVLVVAPKTLITHWIKELSLVGLKHKISDYSGSNLNVRDYELQHAFQEGGILLTTYDIVRINYKLIRGDFYNDADDEEEGKLWDYVILDEAHLIKNPKTQRAQSLFEIPCVHRIAISGTPIQNNLKEMWAIFYFCFPEVLGDKDEFRTRYELPIILGNDKDATNRAKHIGSHVAKELRERIKPYFLRRMKGEVSLDNGLADDKKFPKKNELIIWLKLTDCQVLKKICDHPQILTKRAAEDILEGMEEMGGVLNNQDMGDGRKNGHEPCRYGS